MPPNRKRVRRVTPEWVDTLIVVLEVVGLVGTLAAGIYAVVEWFWGW